MNMTRIEHEENDQWEQDHASDPVYYKLLHFANFGVALGKVITDMRPKQGWSALMRLLMVMVASIPDDKWEELNASCRSPCELPKCDCERLGGITYAVLDELRKEYKDRGHLHED
jgi:hypothetical protein